MAFSEERLELGIRYGTAGGPEFNTSIITVQSGFEQRNSNWEDSRASWNLADDTYSKVELEYMIAFFRARKGKFEGFRYKDWSDYSVDLATSGFVSRNVNTTTDLQLAKVYNTASLPIYSNNNPYAGTSSDIRIINKPAINSVNIYLDGNLATQDVDYTIDYSTGNVTLAADPQGQYVQWIGDFDVPVRFDTDKFSATFEAYRDSDKEAIYTITSLPIVELRIDPTF